jgi:hypothetical protein
MRRAMRVLVLGATIAVCGVPVAHANVLRVGTWNGIEGQFGTIQAAVDAAEPGDWILVAPGDYKELGNPGGEEPAGVLITTPNVHLRGMDRNAVVVDGTRPGTPRCSSSPLDQGPLNRNGIDVYEADNTWIENLTVCNYLNGGEEGNQIWWNGGDGTGHIGLDGFWGNYLTATSSYSSTVPGFSAPAAESITRPGTTGSSPATRPTASSSTPTPATWPTPLTTSAPVSRSATR